MLPVSLAREELAPYVLDSGVCKDSSSALTYINKARRLLWERGDWSGTVDDIRVRAYDGLLTLPPRYHIARNAMMCNHTVAIDTTWCDAVAGVTYVDPCFNKIVDAGAKYGLFREYPLQYRLIVMAEEREDKGKTVTFDTKSPLGHRIAIRASLGSDNEEVKLNDYVRAVNFASKPPTLGRVLVYIFDPNNNIKILAGVYEGTDTLIQMRRYRVPILGSVRERDFFVRAKKKCQPLVDESELVEFPIDALAHALNAITNQRNKEDKAYVAELNLAVEILQNELKENQATSGQQIKLRHSGVYNL